MDRRSTRRRRAHSQKRPVWLVMTLTVVLIALIVVAVWLPSLLKQDPTQPTDPASNPTSSTPTGGAHPESMEELIIHSVTDNHCQEQNSELPDPNQYNKHNKPPKNQYRKTRKIICRHGITKLLALMAIMQI